MKKRTIKKTVSEDFMRTVQKIFKTYEDVNEALLAIVHAIPSQKRGSAR